jgi:hypothetical protein
MSYCGLGFRALQTPLSVITARVNGTIGDINNANNEQWLPQEKKSHTSEGPVQPTNHQLFIRTSHDFGCENRGFSGLIGLRVSPVDYCDL